jgi:hypothetical protein
VNPLTANLLALGLAALLGALELAWRHPHW